jgi:hypothetical protein
MQLGLGDLLATEAHCRRSSTRRWPPRTKVQAAKHSDPGPGGERARPKARRDLLASQLPPFMVEVPDEEPEAEGCRLIGFDDSGQLMFRCAFMVLVKRLRAARLSKTGRRPR